MTSLFCQNCDALIVFTSSTGQGSCSFCEQHFALDAATLPFQAGTHASSRLFDRQRTRLTAVATSARSANEDASQSKGAIVHGEVCAQCGNDQAYFKTAQLRSVDEGQTVFFECTKCGHARAENT
jgi:DNA-directed RNA polymerase I subunit RPA12